MDNILNNWLKKNKCVGNVKVHQQLMYFYNSFFLNRLLPKYEYSCLILDQCSSELYQNVSEHAKIAK